MLVGVASAAVARKMIDTLAAHDVSRAWVVHGGDGLDELSTTTVSQVLSLEHGTIHTFEVDPLAHGIERATMEQLAGRAPGGERRLTCTADGKPGGSRHRHAERGCRSDGSRPRCRSTRHLDRRRDDRRQAGGGGLLGRFVLVSQDAASHSAP